MIDDKNPEAVEEAVVVEEAVEAPSLTVQDLANLRNIIDVASQRGAFKPNEFQVVGDAYTKLANFIAAIAPAPAAEVEVPAEATEGGVAEDAPAEEAGE